MLVSRIESCRAGLLVLVPRRLRQLCTTTSDNGSREIGRDHRHLLQVGLRFLKAQKDDQLVKLMENVVNRGAGADISKLLTLRREYNLLTHQINQLTHERHTNAKKFQSVKSECEREQLVVRGAELKQASAELEAQKHAKEKELIPELALIPNNTHPDVPIGGYDQARVICVHGNQPVFDFPVRDHVSIGEALDILDFHSASQAVGHKFYYLKGSAAMLELALVQHAMQKAEAKGYQPVITPDIVKTSVVEGCGFHPRGESTQVYSLSSPHDQFSLSGTAEIPLAGMFMDTAIPMDQLPIRLVAFGRCYRAESGGYGRADRGLYRVHQFSKVELFGVSANESGRESAELLEEIVDLQREIIEELGLHYRLLDMPTEELGTAAHRKYDIEVWMPGREGFGEVTSASNCTDFQSRRLRITYPNSTSNHRSPRMFAHTVNGTACAIPRIILALLENYQQADGSVVLPDVLRPYLSPTNWHIKPQPSSPPDQDAAS